ncbi:hypothetical protein [Algivirga pacifica]|uniref:SWIM-type domain-containing protein n=1 Tax=Algivirga pacifica TaxID=1162670 RepID=A0ABP9D7V3_9BACT
MTISTFEQYLEKHLLEIGRELHTSNAIRSIEALTPHSWEVCVEDFNAPHRLVNIELKDNEFIKRWKCTCEKDSPICTHTVAALFAIREQSKPTECLSTKELLESQLEQVDDKALHSFLLHEFMESPILRTRFMTHFNNIAELPHAIIRSTLWNTIVYAKGKYTSIEAECIPHITAVLEPLHDKMEKLLDTQRLEDAFVLCQIILEELSTVFQYTDDTERQLHYYMEYCLETLEEIGLRASSELKEQLMTYCSAALRDERFQQNEYALRMLALLPPLIDKNEQEAMFMALLNNLLKEAKKQKDKGKAIKVLHIKYRLLLCRQKHPEAQALLDAYSNVVEFRLMLFKLALKDKNYSKAKNIALEGLAEAEKIQQEDAILLWEQQLLKTAELSDCLKGIQQWAKRLFFKSYHPMKYYHIWKSSYFPEEWDEVIDSLCTQLHTEYFSSKTELLAQIMVEEKHYDCIIKLMLQHRQQLTFVDAYAPHVTIHYPEECLICYQAAIKHYAKIATTSVFQRIPGFLKKMAQITGGKKVADELLLQLKVTYCEQEELIKVLDS